MNESLNETPQWRLAYWLWMQDAPVDNYGIYLEPWEGRPQHIRDCYYQLAADAMEFSELQPTPDTSEPGRYGVRWETFGMSGGSPVGDLMEAVAVYNYHIAKGHRASIYRIHAPNKDQESAYEYACRLFRLVAPQCKPLSTTHGVLTQIDNYIAGLREQVMCPMCKKAAQKAYDLLGRWLLQPGNPSAELERATLDFLGASSPYAHDCPSEISSALDTEEQVTLKPGNVSCAEQPGDSTARVQQEPKLYSQQPDDALLLGLMEAIDRAGTWVDGGASWSISQAGAAQAALDYLRPHLAHREQPEGDAMYHRKDTEEELRQKQREQDARQPVHISCNGCGGGLGGMHSGVCDSFPHGGAITQEEIDQSWWSAPKSEGEAIAAWAWHELTQDDGFFATRRLAGRIDAAIAAATKRESSWQPPHEWPHYGMDIVRSTLLQNHVYLQGKNGDIYRVWLDDIGLPSIECVKYNAELPPEQGRRGSDAKE